MSERKTRSNGRETMAKVLVHARRELDEVGPVKFNIRRVIENAGISHSSMYHHFGGRDGVIAAVEVERMTEGTNAIYSGLRVLLETVATREEAFAAIRAVLAATASDEGRRQRAHRIAIIATAQNIPLLAETMQEDQRWGDAHLAESLRIAMARGLIGPIANPDGVAHLVSTLFIGRAVIDILRDESADASWLDATMATLEFHIPPKG